MGCSAAGAKPVPRLGNLADQVYRELSGREAKRLMIARGIASQLDVFLVDEPTAQLDRATAAEVNRMLTALAEVVVRPASTGEAAGSSGAGEAATSGEAAAEATRFDECWVRMWPESPNIRGQLAGVVAQGAPEDEPPSLSKLNNRFGEEFTGRAQFADRVTRFAPAAAVLFGVVLGFIALRVRRIHLAAALHSGVRRPDLAIMLGIEQTVWTVVSGVLLVNVAVWSALRVPGEDRGALFALAMLTVAALVLGTFAGAALAFATTRERAVQVLQGAVTSQPVRQSPA